ncbi:uncharacterized protein [Typha angustifolia]|uniref:uncharacterized protein n=1 Tax=Typha angustifolia TaxID=59011 RepID=UPI003C2FE70A
MASSSLMAAPTLQFTAGKNSVIKRQEVVSIREKYLQSRRKIQESRLIESVSRRDVMSCMSTTLLSTFIATDHAEARSVKPETRRKIREKLDRLREKAGVPKEKTDSSPEIKEKSVPLDSLRLPLVEASL